MAKRGEPTMVKTTIRIPDELVRKAKHYAVDHDCDFQDVVQQALERFLGGK
jgi:hypothetical protein